MVRTHRWWTAGALIVCVIGAPWSSTLVASEKDGAANDVASTQSTIQTAPHLRLTFADPAALANTSAGEPGAQAWRNEFTFISSESSTLAAQRGYGRRGGGGGRSGSAAALALGAVAMITGAAVLVYANRPECSVNYRADGCGYGTKVVGGAVLSAGIVGLVIGAATWR